MRTKIFILTLLIAGAAQAQTMTAGKGLEKIKTNLENARKNRAEYDRNLQQVKENISEIQKAKEAALMQKKLVSSEIAKNTESLKRIQNQEKVLDTFVAREKAKLEAESKQLIQLQALIDQIKLNQQQRNQIIADYQGQIAAAGNQKKSWKDREEKLRQQENKNTQALRGIASEENSWVGKKKKYENEVKRWSAESEKQQKIHDSYQALSEGR